MTDSRHLRFWLIGLVLFCFVLWVLRDILGPFIAGMAIAYLLDPLTDRLERAGVRRWLGATLVLLAFGIVLVGALLLLIPAIAKQISGLVAALPEYLAAAQRSVIRLSERLRAYITDADLERIQEAAGTYAGDAMSWVGTVLGHLWRGGLALIDVVTFLAITPVVAFYLLRDWDRMVSRIDEWLPRNSAPTIRSLAAQVDETLAGFIRGQGTVCLVLGTFYAVALTIAGLQFGLVVGLGAGLLSFIPYVGSLVGFVSSVGIAMVQFDSWIRWAIIAGIFLFGQLVEGNFLTPKVVGDRVGLHPVWVMFALLAGGSLLGFTGVLLAVPIAAVIGVMARFGLKQYRMSRYYRGEQPLLIESADASPDARP